MRVEIAICTWNRADLLDKTLENLQHLVIPLGVEWELLVVNNNCTDATDEVLVRHARHLPLRRLIEPQPGVSYARNRVSAAARGELLLWTDDDVLVDKYWLANYVEAAQRHPYASFFGGPIEPWLETTAPTWLEEMLQVSGIDGVYAVRRLGDRILRFDASNTRDLPYGANFAIRTCVQKKYCYDTRLGRFGKVAISGEETMLQRRIVEDDHYGLWIPTARVRHFIPTERLNLDFIRRFFVGLGRTNYRSGVCFSAKRRRWIRLEVMAADLMCRWYGWTNRHRLNAQFIMHGCQLRGWLQEAAAAK